MSNEVVKNPSHYCEGRKYEPKDIIREFKLNFNLGSAVKYISRAGRKDDIIIELEKAREFIRFEIEWIETHLDEVPEYVKANPDILIYDIKEDWGVVENYFLGGALFYILQAGKAHFTYSTPAESIIADLTVARRYLRNYISELKQREDEVYGYTE